MKRKLHSFEPDRMPDSISCGRGGKLSYFSGGSFPCFDFVGGSFPGFIFLLQGSKKCVILFSSNIFSEYSFICAAVGGVFW